MPVICLVVDQIGDMFDQPRFVDVIRDFIDDKPLPVGMSSISSTRITPRRINFAASGVVGFFDAPISADDAAGREVGTRHHLHDLIDGRLRDCQDQQWWL